MPMDFLRRIAERDLPCTVYDPGEIDHLRVLRAAGLIQAFIPLPDRLNRGQMCQKAAQVLAITQKGRDVLKGRLEA